MPTGVLDRADPSTPVAIVLTRERTDPLDRWRSDPEPSVVRRLALPRALPTDAAVTLRLDRRATDEVLASLTGQDRGDLVDRRLAGNPDAHRLARRRRRPGDGVDVAVRRPGRLDADRRPRPGRSGSLADDPPGDRRRPLGDHRDACDDRRQDGRADVPAPDSSGASTVDAAGVAAPSMTVGDVDRPEDDGRPALRRGDDAARGDHRAGQPGDRQGARWWRRRNRRAATTCSPSTGRRCRSRSEPPGRRARRRPGGDRRGRATARRSTSPPARTSSPARRADSGIDVDRVVLSSGRAVAPTAAPAVTVRRSDFTRSATVAPCPERLLADPRRGGQPRLVGVGRRPVARAHPRQLSGGFSAWQLPPSTSPTTVTMTWRPQTGLDVALALSVAGIVLCLLLVWFGRRRGDPVDLPAARPAFAGHLLAPVSRRRRARRRARRPRRRDAADLLDVRPRRRGASPRRGAHPTPGARRRRRRGPRRDARADVLWRQHADLYFVNASWPGHFEDLHHWGLLVVVLLLTSVRPAPAPDPSESPPDVAFVSRR